jgi:hypothetical protein
MVGPDGDALLQERWHRKYRRSAYTGERGATRHLVGDGVTVLLLRAALARLIPCHSRHIVGGHRHRHGAQAYRHRHREGDDESKKQAGDRFRHEGKVTPAEGHFKRAGPGSPREAVRRVMEG